MEEIIEEDDEKSKDSNKTPPSLNSVIEMSSKSRTLFSVSLFVINIISNENYLLLQK